MSEPAKTSRSLPATLLAALESAVPGRLLTDSAILLAYECDGLTHFRSRPSAVVLPESTSEVQAIVRACRDAGVPITPRGAGTGLSAGAVASPSAVLVVTSRMKRVLRVDVENRLATVQPGLVNARLTEAVAPHGLAYAPDPSSQSVCTVGGNVGENAGGPHGLQYGSTSHHIRSLRVVLADGRNLLIGHPSGSPQGLDLRGLFVGSEGTLGIVTEVTCRLVPTRSDRTTALAAFESLVAAGRAVSEIISAGIVPTALEALDRRTIRAVEASVHRAGYPIDAAAVLLVEVEGHPAHVRETGRAIESILRRHQALSVERADDPEQRRRLWKGRKGAFGALGRLAPDLYVLDAVVPRSRLPDALDRIDALGESLGLSIANVFHAGDGNLHPNIAYDGRDADAVRRVLAAARGIVEICVSLGGTLSGEHGIGLEKRDFLTMVAGPEDIETQRRVRAVLDPKGLMNPDKVLPTPGTCGEMSRPGSPRSDRARLEG